MSTHNHYIQRFIKNRGLSPIYSFIPDESQFIIATHSPIIMAYPNADIFLLTKDGIDRTEYKDTEHYQTTKNFLDNPERMINLLTKN